MRSLSSRAHQLFASAAKLGWARSAPLSSMASRERKRFYQHVSVSESSVNAYEISLDKRKLKTPTGKPLLVDNRLFAHMVAQEWSSQGVTLKQTTMHLTSLLNTCADNPNKVTKEALIANICDYLHTDTVLFFHADEASSTKQLHELQTQRWLPLVDWFNERFDGVHMSVQRDIDVPIGAHADANAEASLQQQRYAPFVRFLDANFELNTLVAFNYMCESLKSVIVSVALLERRVASVDEACALANLEQAFQYDKWGKVEWYHAVNEEELRARVSAALLFVYLSSNSKYLVIKDTTPTNNVK